MAYATPYLSQAAFTLAVQISAATASPPATTSFTLSAVTLIGV